MYAYQIRLYSKPFWFFLMVNQEGWANQEAIEKRA
jgi:hypothetical protein